MSRWFRFYNEALDDPKVQQLDPVVFKHWVNLLCIACRHDGKLPNHDAMAFSLRLDIIGLESLLDRLLIAGLIDVRKGGPNGSYIAPHGWEKRQYKSDTSTERVKRFRNVAVTANETAPETDTDTDVVIAKAITTPRKRMAKGKRIEPDWKPGALPPKVADLTAQWPSGRIDRELDAFRDYWTARTRDACKLDWDLTWHNRIRDIHDQVMKDANHGKQDKRNGVARAIDNRLGFGEFAGAAGRRSVGDGPQDRNGPLALPSPGD